MKTKKEITFNTLNSYFLNTATMKINEEYLNHLLNIHCFNSDRQLYEDMKNKRTKSRNLAWRGLIGLTNELINCEEYPVKYYATGEQLKKWLNEYGRGYETIAETVNDIETYRQEELFAE